MQIKKESLADRLACIRERMNLILFEDCVNRPIIEEARRMYEESTNKFKYPKIADQSSIPNFPAKVFQLFQSSKS